MPRNKVLEIVRSNDPSLMIFKMVAKVGLAMVVYFAFALLFQFNTDVVIWTMYYLAFAGLSTAKSDVQTRRIVFVLFTISFYIVLVSSSFLYQLQNWNIFLILIGCYLAYWLKRFGHIFDSFQIFILVVLCIACMRMPLEQSDIYEETLSFLFASGVFYLLTLAWGGWDTPKILKSQVLRFLIDLYRDNRQNLLAIKKSNYSSRQLVKQYDHYKARALLMNEKASTWIIKSQRKMAWQSLCYDLVALSKISGSLIYHYKSFFYKVKLLFPKQHNMPLIQLLYDLCFRTLQLTTHAVTIHDNEYFEMQISDLEQQRCQFEQVFFQHSLANSEDRKLVFEIILLIDDMIVMIRQLRGHAHDLI